MKFIFFNIWDKGVFTPMTSQSNLLTPIEFEELVHKISGFRAKASIVDGSLQIALKTGVPTNLKSGWYDSEGFPVAQFITVEGLNLNQIKTLMPLDAPWFQAFWSDYQLFCDPLKAFQYADQFVDHYNSDGDDANRPHSFEQFTVPGTGFDLTWITRSGNQLYYKYCPGYESTQEVDGEEGHFLWVEEETCVSVQTTTGIAYGLFELLNTLDHEKLLSRTPAISIKFEQTTP